MADTQLFDAKQSYEAPDLLDAKNLPIFRVYALNPKLNINPKFAFKKLGKYLAQHCTIKAPNCQTMQLEA